MHKFEEKRQVRLRLVLVQKRTRLEFLRRMIGHLYTWTRVNTNNGCNYKYKEMHHHLVSNCTKGDTAIKKSIGVKVSIDESKARKSGHESIIVR